MTPTQFLKAHDMSESMSNGVEVGWGIPVEEVQAATNKRYQFFIQDAG